MTKWLIEVIEGVIMYIFCNIMLQKMKFMYVLEKKENQKQYILV